MRFADNRQAALYTMLCHTISIRLLILHDSKVRDRRALQLCTAFSARRPPCYTVTCVPTSTTRPVGIWKKSVASEALRASEMNR